MSKDRGGNDYQLAELRDPKGRTVGTWLISATRQAKKALGLSGRQYKKRVKAARRLT